MTELRIHRLHALDGDHEDLGWYSKGHHDEQAFRQALEDSFWLNGPVGRERFKHPSEADETECRFVRAWWRVVGGRFHAAAENARGAFPVTAMLTPDAEI